MSSSEDYLDSLLNSINKAKTDVDDNYKKVEQDRQTEIENRNKISYDQDFMEASGISGFRHQKMERTNLRSFFSESEFLKEFEEELYDGDASDFIKDFEREIDEDERLFEETGEVSDAEKTVANLIDGIEDIVSNINSSLDTSSKTEAEKNEANSFNADSEEEDFSLLDSFGSDDNLDVNVSVSDDYEVDTLTDVASDLNASNDESNEEAPTEEQPVEEQAIHDEQSDAEAAAELEALFGFSDETSNDASDNNVMDEFAPDSFDEEESILDEDADVDLADLIGEDSDLADISGLLNSDEEGLELDESRAEFETAADAAFDESSDDNSDEEDGKKGKKKKKSKNKDKSDKGSSDKAPAGFLGKIMTLLFGEDDDDDVEVVIRENEKVDTKELDQENMDILNSLTDDDTPVTVPSPGEEKGKKGKKEKKEKKPKEPKPKKEKKPKEPKPKKEKKPKEPDNSPKIPFKVIIIFVVFAVSVIALVNFASNLLGDAMIYSEAESYYENGDYVDAYDKLNGMELDEKGQVFRAKARLLADLQQSINEYNIFMGKKLYDFALDSLIKGVARYSENRDTAVSYEILDQYDSFGNMLEDQLMMQFGVSKEEAIAVYNSKNRHVYTVELRKILMRMGFE